MPVMRNIADLVPANNEVLALFVFVRRVVRWVGRGCGRLRKEHW